MHRLWERVKKLSIRGGDDDVATQNNNFEWSQGLKSTPLGLKNNLCSVLMLNILKYPTWRPRYKNICVHIMIILLYIKMRRKTYFPMLSHKKLGRKMYLRSTFSNYINRVLNEFIYKITNNHKIIFEGCAYCQHFEIKMR